MARTKKNNKKKKDSQSAKKTGMTTSLDDVPYGELTSAQKAARTRAANKAAKEFLLLLEKQKVHLAGHDSNTLKKPIRYATAEAISNAVWWQVGAKNVSADIIKHTSGNTACTSKNIRSQKRKITSSSEPSSDEELERKKAKKKKLSKLGASDRTKYSDANVDEETSDDDEIKLQAISSDSNVNVQHRQAANLDSDSEESDERSSNNDSSNSGSEEFDSGTQENNDNDLEDMALHKLTKQFMDEKPGWGGGNSESSSDDKISRVPPKHKLTAQRSSYKENTNQDGTRGFDHYPRDRGNRQHDTLGTHGKRFDQQKYETPYFSDGPVRTGARRSKHTSHRASRYAYDSNSGDSGKEDISRRNKYKSSKWPSSTDLVYSGRNIDLLKQSQDIQDLLHCTNDRVQGDIFFVNTFPDPQEKIRFVRKALETSAKKLHLQDIRRRLKADSHYINQLGKVSLDRISVWRGSLKTTAVQNVNLSYSLTDRCSERVARLLQGQSYIHPDDIMKGTFARNKPYEHPLIAEVIWAVLFKPPKKKGMIQSLADKHCSHFIAAFEGGELKIPDPMIASASTAVHAALKERTNGQHESIEFGADEFTDVYITHIITLKKLKREKPSAYHRMKAAIYFDVSTRSKPAQARIPDRTKDVIANIDFSAIED